MAPSELENVGRIQQKSPEKKKRSEMKKQSQMPAASLADRPAVRRMPAASSADRPAELYSTLLPKSHESQLDRRNVRYMICSSEGAHAFVCQALTSNGPNNIY